MLAGDHPRSGDIGASDDRHEIEASAAAAARHGLEKKVAQGYEVFKLLSGGEDRAGNARSFALGP